MTMYGNLLAGVKDPIVRDLFRKTDGKFDDLSALETLVRNNEVVLNHSELLGAGTKTHDQIDAHIDATNNPHTVTLQQAATANNTVSADVTLSGEVTHSGEIRGSLIPLVFSNTGGAVGTALPQYGTMAGLAGSFTQGVPLPAGSVAAVYWNTSVTAYSSGNTLEVDVRVNGTSVFPVTAVVSGNGAVTVGSSQARGTDTFSANSEIQVYLSEFSGSGSYNITAGFGTVLLYID